MRIVSLAQNSKEWKDWRGKGIGASDAPVVMGASPWQTPLELWLDKTGLKKRGEFNAFQVEAMRRGTELEPLARELFEKQQGRSYPSLSAEHDDYYFIRASFDGYNSDENTIIEIKCPGKADHAKAVKGEVPSKYYPQIQQQLLVSGAIKCYYFSWDGKSPTGATVEVLPSPAYQNELLNKLKDFWERVQTLTLPEFDYSDILRVSSELDKKTKEIAALTGVLQMLLGAKANDSSGTGVLGTSK